MGSSERGTCACDRTFAIGELSTQRGESGVRFRPAQLGTSQPVVRCGQRRGRGIDGTHRPIQLLLRSRELALGRTMSALGIVDIALQQAPFGGGWRGIIGSCRLALRPRSSWRWLETGEQLGFAWPMVTQCRGTELLHFGRVSCDLDQPRRELGRVGRASTARQHLCRMSGERTRSLAQLPQRSPQIGAGTGLDRRRLGVANGGGRLGEGVDGVGMFGGRDVQRPVAPRRAS